MRLRLPQTVVYFAPNGTDGFGMPKLAAPVELARRARWEDKLTETIDKDGDTVLSFATVYLNVPVRIGGILILGTMAQTVDSSGWDAANVPGNPDTHEIVSIGSVPNLRATQTLYTAMLK